VKVILGRGKHRLVRGLTVLASTAYEMAKFIDKYQEELQEGWRRVDHGKWGGRSAPERGKVGFGDSSPPIGGKIK